MGRSNLQGTPWHYETNYEMLNNMPKKAVPRSASKDCYFEYMTCENPNSKNYKKECVGFALCRDFTLTGKQPKTYKDRKK